MIRFYWPILATLALSGCINLAPDYQQPEAPVPTEWQATVSGDVVADIQW